MAFNTHQIRFLQRLVQESPTHRLAGEVSRHFCEHYSLGTAVGRQIQYREDHHRMARSLLLSNDLPLESLPVASRADIAVFGGLSEKALSAAPHAGSVAVKCIGNCTLDGVPLRTPPGTHLIVTPETGSRIQCERLLVVENLETFRQLERYSWIDYRNLTVLAVYRGDPTLSTGGAAGVVRERAEPIWAFVDFDPAGLLIANALPADRLERLILPSPRWLQQAANTSRGRQLFADQETTASAALDRSTSPEVRSGWGVMRELRSGVTQERMLQATSVS